MKIQYKDKIIEANEKEKIGKVLEEEIKYIFSVIKVN